MTQTNDESFYSDSDRITPYTDEMDKEFISRLLVKKISIERSSGLV